MDKARTVGQLMSKRSLVAVVSSAMMAMTLAGCGGGGATKDVVVNKPGVALFTTAGTSVSVEVGANVVYKVGGGGGGSNFASYSITSSNPDILGVSIIGDTFTLTGLKSGAATVNVKDQTGASVEIKVTIGSSSVLTILAPAAVSGQVGDISTFKVSGGTPPYTVVSSNVGVVSPRISDTGDAIVLNNLAAGGATIAVYDAKGASTNITATVVKGNVVVAPLYTTSPSFISLSPGGSIPVYQIGGGTPPYTVVSSSPDVFEVAQVGTSYSVKGKALGFGTISIRDAVAAITNVSVSIVSGKVDVPFYSTAPASLTLKQGDTGTYAIAGGTPPYVAVTNNQSVVSASISGSSVTVTGVASGAANISLRDAVGASISFAVTVPSSTTTQNNVALYTTAPSDVTLQTATVSNFTVAGGTGPYTVTSSNTSVAYVSISQNTLSITGVSAGTAKIVVSDSLGAINTISVTVAVPNQSPNPLFTTAPSSIVAKAGSTYPFALTGGTAPYAVTSSNTAVATASVSGSTVSIVGVAAGTANIYMTDSVGGAINVAVTVQ